MIWRRLCEAGLASSLSDAMEQPIGLALRALEERAFEEAYRALNEAQSEADVPTTPMVQVVKTIKTAAWYERMREIGQLPT